MPPTLIIAILLRRRRNNIIRNPRKLIRRHLRQVVEVDNRPTAGGRAAHDVAACGLRVAIAVEAVTEVDAAAAVITIAVDASE